MTTNHSFASLPQDLIIEILLLLPFDSLLNWKLVSKKWKSLINDSKFSNRYRNKSMAVFFDGKSLYCALMRPNYNITRYPPPYTVHRLPIELPDIGVGLFVHTLISGSSSGIACVIAGSGHLLSYNLFTGVTYRVKNAPMRRRDILSSLRYGSGYSPSDDDYKIMVVCPAKDLKEPQCLFWVYSFNNHSWKSVDGFPYASYGWSDLTCVRREAYSLNGVLHWLSITRGEGVLQKQVIVTYDLRTHKFGELLVPYGALFGSLTELDGRLCCVYRMCNEWVMERYGVGGYWSKLLSFDPLRIKTAFFVNQLVYTALYECGDGRKVVSFLMFGKDVPRMISYNINKDKIKIIPSSQFNRHWDSQL